MKPEAAADGDLVPTKHVDALHSLLACATLLNGNTLSVTRNSDCIRGTCLITDEKNVAPSDYSVVHIESSSDHDDSKDNNSETSNSHDVGNDSIIELVDSSRPTSEESSYERDNSVGSILSTASVIEKNISESRVTDSHIFSPALDIAAHPIDEWWPSEASLDKKGQIQTTEGVTHSKENNKYDTKSPGEIDMIEDKEVKLYYFLET